MAAQAGSGVLIQIGDDTSPAGYVTIGGLRTKSLSFNGESIDITNDDSSGWMEILDAQGINSVEVSGSGVFTDEQGFHRVWEAWENKTLTYFKLTIPSFRTIEAKFKVTSISAAGEYNGEVTYDISLQSSGVPFIATV